jgi:hypothetical protein
VGNFLPLLAAVMMILTAGVGIVIFVVTGRNMTTFVSDRMDKLEGKLDSLGERTGAVERKVDVLTAQGEWTRHTSGRGTE